MPMTRADRPALRAPKPQAGFPAEFDMQIYAAILVNLSCGPWTFK